MDTCEKCRFWKRYDENPQWSHCRRYPPRWYVEGSEGDINSYACFPNAEPSSWCGEFKAKEANGKD